MIKGREKTETGKESKGIRYEMEYNKNERRKLDTKREEKHKFASYQ